MNMKIDIIVRAFLFNQEGNILMTRHEPNALWVLPGGHVEAGETLHTALKREIREEFGISAEFFDIDAHETLHHWWKKLHHFPLPISIYELQYTHRSGEEKRRVEHIFLMETHEVIVDVQADEIAEYQWFDPEKIFSMKPNIDTWDFYIEMLQKIVDPDDDMYA